MAGEVQRCGKNTQTFARLETLLEDPPKSPGSNEVDFPALRAAVSCLFQEQQSLVSLSGEEIKEFLGGWEKIYRHPGYSYRDADGRVRNVLFDLDGDGVYDAATPRERQRGIEEDRFPMDSRYATDQDRDGVPDTIDLFPNRADRFSSEETATTKVLLYPDPNGLSQDIFGSTVRRWQEDINHFIQRRLTDRSVRWNVEITAVDDVRTLRDLPPEVNAVKVVEPSTDDPHEGMWEFRWNVGAGIWAVAHEAGHLLGLKDRYDFVGWSELAQPTLQERLQRRLLVRDHDMMGRWEKDGENYIIYADDIKMMIASKAKWPVMLDMAQHLSASKDPPKLRQALELYDSVLALNPDHPMAREGREKTLISLSAHRPRQTVWDILLGGFDLFIAGGQF